MKINFTSFKSVLMIFALIEVMVVGAYPAISSAEERDRNTITIQGSSSITVSPDSIRQYRGNDVQQKCGVSTERKCRKDGQSV